MSSVVGSASGLPLLSKQQTQVVGDQGEGGINKLKKMVKDLESEKSEYLKSN